MLVLCTGNICRSPMAEGLLRRRLSERGVVATVASAGLSLVDRPATPDAVAAASAYGVDISPHRSRIMSAALVRDADLIVAMERLHAREVFMLDRTAAERCFTLKELVRRGTAIGPRPADEPLAAWLRRAAAARRPAELMGASVDDDVADPYQRARVNYDRCIDEIDGLVTRLVDLAWPVPATREGVA
ncbi:MAG TPA: hypothetical protein VGJ03_15935 [Acidimicrobiales bacterium]